MTFEDPSTEVYSYGIEQKVYEPSGHALIFIEDMMQAMCHKDSCEYKMDTCFHSRLAHELLKAMLDSYSDFLDKHDQPEAAKLLRSEM
jgi:hypothetical protein